MQPFQPVVSPSASAIAGWMSSNNASLPHAAVAAGPPGLVQPPNAGKPSFSCPFLMWSSLFKKYLLLKTVEFSIPAVAFLKHPRTPTSAPGMDYQSADSEHLMKRMRTGQSDEV